MSENEIKSIAEHIQKKSEEIHVASVILATEQILYDKIIGDAFEKKISEYKDLLARAYSEKDVSVAAGLTADALKLNEALAQIIPEQRPRIHVIYTDLNEGSARFTYADDAIRIVMSDKHQSKILEGLRHNSGKWTKDMVKSKIALRKLALHELYHILPEVISDEDCADLFSDELYKIREERNKSISQFAE